MAVTKIRKKIIKRSPKVTGDVDGDTGRKQRDSSQILHDSYKKVFADNTELRELNFILRETENQIKHDLQYAGNPDKVINDFVSKAQTRVINQYLKSIQDLHTNSSKFLKNKHADLSQYKKSKDKYPRGWMSTDKQIKKVMKKNKYMVPILNHIFNINRFTHDNQNHLSDTEMVKVRDKTLDATKTPSTFITSVE